MADLYVPLDVNAPDDPKIIAAGDLAELLFYRSLCLAKRLLSDGFIAAGQVVRLGGSEDSADRLVQTGLWAEVEGGYLIVSFLKRNSSREKVEESRRTDAERKAKWRAGQDKPATPPSAGTEPSRPKGQPDRATRSEDRVIVKSETESKSESSTIAPKSGARRPDQLFNAVVEACGIEYASLTGSARGVLNRACAELRGAKANPTDVPVRAANYHATYPDNALTPSALAKHWPALAKPPSNGTGNLSKGGQALERVLSAMEGNDAH